jgi:predicted DNA-binding antitoxin AbrB/MazE fold protein
MMVMDKSISGIYENGVFRPLVPVDLPEQTPVVITPKMIPGSGDGIRLSAGSWSGADAELDAWLEKLSEMRRSGRGLLGSDEPRP